MSEKRVLIASNTREAFIDLLRLVSQFEDWVFCGGSSTREGLVYLARKHSAECILMDPESILSNFPGSVSSVIEELPDIMLVAIQPGEDGFCVRVTKNGREVFMHRDFLEATDPDEEQQLLH